MSSDLFSAFAALTRDATEAHRAQQEASAQEAAKQRAERLERIQRTATERVGEYLELSTVPDDWQAIDYGDGYDRVALRVTEDDTYLLWKPDTFDLLLCDRCTQCGALIERSGYGYRISDLASLGAVLADDPLRLVNHEKAHRDEDDEDPQRPPKKATREVPADAYVANDAERQVLEGLRKLIAPNAVQEGEGF